MTQPIAPRRPDSPLDWVGRSIPATDVVITSVLGNCAFRARSERLRRDFYVKVVPKHVPGAPTDALRLLGRQVSPHVAKLVRIAPIGNWSAIVIEWADGVPLPRWIAERGLLTAAQGLEVIRQLALALNEFHYNCVAQLAVEPRNVLIEERAGELIVRLVGLENARRSGEATPSLDARIPHYTAPEILAEGRCTTSADLYALGATMFYGLCGRPPFDGSFATVANAQLFAVAPAIPDLRPRLSGRTVARLAARLLEKDPRARPIDAASVIEAAQFDRARPPFEPR